MFIIGIKDDAKPEELKKLKDFLLQHDAIVIQEYTVGSMAVQLPPNYIHLMNDISSYQVVEFVERDSTMSINK